MRTDRVENMEQIRIALEVECPICQADIGCLCDQFQAPHPLPFTVHIERFESAWALFGNLHNVEEFTVTLQVRMDEGAPVDVTVQKDGSLKVGNAD